MYTGSRMFLVETFDPGNIRSFPEGLGTVRLADPPVWYPCGSRLMRKRTPMGGRDFMPGLRVSGEDFNHKCTQKPGAKAYCSWVVWGGRGRGGAYEEAVESDTVGYGGGENMQ
ncbi:hypothetical protein CYMTET_45955 [Cymbomonas tetramitiformis]|uniref:Uncharacterized protein n=1 Tax=Cymbomonas tetramitiformis TaxID=36881 RepID=A0AAE0BX51_9CHLO|nr:hypothetical protein CYMTET_45955 [Cymbomonas tetramitiformis]